MAETPNNGGVSCIFVDCDDLNATCTYSCFPSVDPLPLFPPPPPPPPATSSESHLAPYLIAIVCVLGMSFLLLTTCTIILRYRFTRSRRRQGVTPSNPDNSGVNNDHTFVDHPIWHITTVGLQQSVIDSITAFKYKKIDGFLADGSDSSCSVCLTEFEDGDDLRLLPKCSHAFHVSCIDTWLRSHKNCPLCRAPIVNEVLGGNSVVGNVNSSFDVDSQRVRVPLDDNNGGEGSSNQFREREDELGRLPMFEGIKIAEILNRNRDLRIFSDLGQNHRFRGVDDDGLNSVRRSISFNAIAPSAKYGAMMSNEGCSIDGSSNKDCSSDGSSNEDCSSDGSSNEGCSSGGSSEGVLQQKKTDLKKEGNKRGSSMSGLLIKSSSIGRSLQKGPVSMKRSLSSSSRFFSFRRSKSQASILPL